MAIIQRNDYGCIAVHFSEAQYEQRWKVLGCSREQSELIGSGSLHPSEDEGLYQV